MSLYKIECLESRKYKQSNFILSLIIQEKLTWLYIYYFRLRRSVLPKIIFQCRLDVRIIVKRKLFLSSLLFIFLFIFSLYFNNLFNLSILFDQSCMSIFLIGSICCCIKLFYSVCIVVSVLSDKLIMEVSGQIIFDAHSCPVVQFSIIDNNSHSILNYKQKKSGTLAAISINLILNFIYFVYIILAQFIIIRHCMDSHRRYQMVNLRQFLLFQVLTIY